MLDTLVLASLGIALLTELAVVAALVVSVVRPEHRVWPPGDVSWRFWFYWGASTVAFVALTYVGYRTAGTFLFRGRNWDLLGGALAVAGLAVAGWAGYTFRMAESFGLEGELHTDGPYHYTRNPQYVGMYATLAGVVLVVNSRLLLVGLLPVAVWMYLLPLAEEPWLREQFGSEYERYCRRVPRFLGIRTLRRLRE